VTTHVHTRIHHLSTAARAGEGGMTLLEVMFATLILAIAAAGVVGSFNAARNETSYSEKRNTATVLAEQEILRLTALPWNEIANNKESPPTSESASTTNPSHYVVAGKCAEHTLPPPREPCYQYDWTKSASIEPLVLEKETVINKAEPAEDHPDPYSFETKNAKGTARITGKVYRYITWVYDKNCTVTNCTSENTESNYKRITVAVTVAGMKTPVVLSTLYANPVGGTNNPIVDGSTCKEKGVTVKCTN
jgi:type II secretory pathway pseudopilin PulG